MSGFRWVALILGSYGSLAAAACGGGCAGGSGSGASGGGDDRCGSDSDCILADPSCGNCGCPTRPMTKAALDAQHERCVGVEVRCAPAECPEIHQRAACVNDRCVAVDLSPAPPAPPAPTAGSETSCQTNADCTSVPTVCCACELGDWVPANRASNAAVTARHARTDCEPCPQQDCPPFDRLCTNGHCELRGR